MLAPMGGSPSRKRKFDGLTTSFPPLVAIALGRCRGNRSLHAEALDITAGLIDPIRLPSPAAPRPRWIVGMTVFGERIAGLGAHRATTAPHKQVGYVKSGLLGHGLDLFPDFDPFTILLDRNHGLGWYGSGKSFAGVNVDGPVSYGWSGGALGIDAAAHRGALAAGAPTVVVIGSGVARPTPHEHESLFEQVIACGGALVSRLDDEAPARTPHYHARNAVLAAATRLTLVIECGLRSGALSTARHATTLGRPVAFVLSVEL